MGCACRQNRGINQNSSSKELIISEVLEGNPDLLKKVFNVSTPDNTKNSGITAESYKENITLEPVVAVNTVENTTKSTVITNTTAASPASRVTDGKPNIPEVITEALENDLKSCYLCAKKHLVRAQIFFEEYHTGYPDHIKNLVQSLRVAEVQVRGAFLRWQKVMGHLDMAANELLGNDINSPTMSKEHIILANKIRDARIRLSDNPLASINFDELITRVHLLQYKELDK